MAKIRQLSPAIVAKIAAGEVIERPAYAVKELIENAIDANATDIQIFIEQAGLKKIQVIDNGEGMDQEDLLACFQPHTTSKLLDEDLTGITTLGFRGEALASLVAVSDLTIKSRIESDAVGNEITLHGGEIQKKTPTGMPSGTIVTVHNLFASVPARKKFLKSTQTESRHIISMVTHFASAFPNIRFALYHNGRVIFDVPAEEQQIERIKRLVGNDVFSFFIPVKYQDSYISISGFIAKPQINSSTSAKQFLFVNNRKVTDKTIALAVKESYGTMLEATMYPIFVLFLSIPHQLVDINMHPRKEQVSFVHTHDIFNGVKAAIMQTLQENNLTFQNLSWKHSGVGTTTSLAANILRKQVLEKELLIGDLKIPPVQFHKLYILLQTKHGIVFIDQHAAHERVLFEKLQKEFLRMITKQKSSKLSKPITINFLPSEQSLIIEHKNIFTKMGFIFIIKKDISVTHVPYFLRDRNPLELIKNILEYLEEDLPIPRLDKISEHMLAFLACRGAVKAGDLLNQKQMNKIIMQLETTSNNATCPHGRPTRMFYSLEELKKNFKR
ncbi:MAG: DNA mismatch repair endonuclease MutL [Patescibacteria group bacterium]|nr:DNA mismatch repair endonuclease MutL [Patescibacteria group bacterium]MDE2588305.1 DNA mismatch repair endonuclease MutL [Patescibacteria group bacterium]